MAQAAVGTRTRIGIASRDVDYRFLLVFGVLATEAGLLASALLSGKIPAAVLALFRALLTL